jgi:hypothetical protein
VVKAFIRLLVLVATNVLNHASIVSETNSTAQLVITKVIFKLFFQPIDLEGEEAESDDARRPHARAPGDHRNPLGVTEHVELERHGPEAA